MRINLEEEFRPSGTPHIPKWCSLWLILIGIKYDFHLAACYIWIYIYMLYWWVPHIVVLLALGRCCDGKTNLAQISDINQFKVYTTAINPWSCTEWPCFNLTRSLEAPKNHPSVETRYMYVPASATKDICLVLIRLSAAPYLTKALGYGQSMPRIEPIEWRRDIAGAPWARLSSWHHRESFDSASQWALHELVWHFSSSIRLYLYGGVSISNHHIGGWSPWK